MITHILRLTALVIFVGVITWINPGSVLVAALVILPYLFLLAWLNYQCIHLIQHLVENYHRPDTQFNVESLPHRPKSLTGLNL